MWYIIGILVSWFIFTLALTIHYDETKVDDIVTNSAMGILLAILWPITLIAGFVVGLVYYTVRWYRGNSN
jgi:hypothetical protein